MRADTTALALAVLAFVCCAAPSAAQRQAATTAALLDTASIEGKNTFESPDTSAVDVSEDGAHDEDPRTAREPGWLANSSFFALRLLTSRHSSVPTRMPTAAYRDMYVVDLRAGWTLASNGFLSVEYAPGVVPLAISTRNPRAYEPVPVTVCPQGKSCNDYTATEYTTVPLYSTAYGFGLTPVSFQLRLFPSSPVQLLTYANGGALWFTQPIPDPEATRFNFTAELGAAIQLNLPDRLGLVVGYSWHHTSNAGTGHVNPGLNSRALSLGIVARRGR